MATTPANIYFAPNDMIDILSSSGVTLRQDDTPPSTYGGAAAKAGNRIDFYLFRHYDPVDLAKSDLVKDWAATIACFYLCTRRGNPCPPGIAMLYDQALADINEIRKGQNEIPGIPRRKSYVPVVHKMRATLRPFPRAVVESSLGSQATGQPANFHQHKDPWELFGVNTNVYLDLSI